MKSIDTCRQFLKANWEIGWDDLETDQKNKVPPPPTQKPYPEGATLLDLVDPQEITVGRMPLFEVIEHRRSHRKYAAEALSLEELSFLLWATQGLQKVFTQTQASFRTVPSGGGRHPFETYLLINNVTGVEPGLYRYLPVEHKLYLVSAAPEMVAKVHEACFEQFVAKSAVTFVWTVIPYRAEWRYSILAHKVIAIDAGHLCQNLYLATEAIGAGTCAIGAYDQKKLDRALLVDGEEEFAIYVATVGKLMRRR
jgi:SagB-type dehydrogenase family enzyme